MSLEEFLEYFPDHCNKYAYSCVFIKSLTFSHFNLSLYKVVPVSDGYMSMNPYGETLPYRFTMLHITDNLLQKRSRDLCFEFYTDACAEIERIVQMELEL